MVQAMSRWHRYDENALIGGGVLQNRPMVEAMSRWHRYAGNSSTPPLINAFSYAGNSRSVLFVCQCNRSLLPVYEVSFATDTHGTGITM